MESILEDIRVCDLTHVWYGPWTTMMLAARAQPDLDKDLADWKK